MFGGNADGRAILNNNSIGLLPCLCSGLLAGVSIKPTAPRRLHRYPKHFTNLQKRIRPVGPTRRCDYVLTDDRRCNTHATVAYIQSQEQGKDDF
jgi:hypothetical protein